MITLADGPFGCFLLVAEDGRTRLVQHDQDFPGVASTFGWKAPATLSRDGIWAAFEFLDAHIGQAVEDPGYFSEEGSVNVVLSERELATVLAALRLWQRHLADGNGRDISPDHFDEADPLSADEVDALCERFNTGDRHVPDPANAD